MAKHHRDARTFDLAPDATACARRAIFCWTANAASSAPVGPSQSIAKLHCARRTAASRITVSSCTAPWPSGREVDRPRRRPARARRASVERDGSPDVTNFGAISTVFGARDSPATAEATSVATGERRALASACEEAPRRAGCSSARARSARVARAAPPAQRPLLAALVPEDQQVDAQRLDHPRDDLDRHAVEQVRRHREAALDQQRRGILPGRLRCACGRCRAWAPARFARRAGTATGRSATHDRRGRCARTSAMRCTHSSTASFDSGETS